jgi:antitoxin Phd
MPNSFSIAEARHDLAAVVHQLEHQPRIQLTRRGKPVAVLLSVREYNRLTAQTRSFWETYTAFAESVDLRDLEIEPQVFEGVRDRSSGREVQW